VRAGGVTLLPSISGPGASALLLVAGSAAIVAAGRLLPAPGRTGAAMAAAAILVAVLCMPSALAVELAGHWQAGLKPSQSAYGAMVYMASVLFGQIAAALLVMGLFAVARLLARRMDRERRVTFDNLALLYHYATVQSLLGLALVHLFPRLVA
jgi:cytochrome c oxidase subunit I+III